MLEKLPEVVGRSLQSQRAGIENIVFNALQLRDGQGLIEVRSAAFEEGGPIPPQYTADGAGLSPPLEWAGVPYAASSLVLLVEDADAPTPHPLVHAIVVDISAQKQQLAEGALKSPGHEGEGVKVGRNSFLQAGWLPPDPPPAHGVHRYAFQLFAMSEAPLFSSAPGRDEVVAAIRERCVASGCLIGTYERSAT